MTTRTKIGLILGTLFILTMALKKFILTCVDDDGFLINLSTEILGAIVTLYIVDKILKDEEERQKQELLAAAIKSLKNPLRRYTNMWLHISNSNEDQFNNELSAANSLREYLLTDTFINKVKMRSFNERYTEATIFGSHDNRTLKEQVPKMVDQFMLDINRVIGNYAHAFNPSTIELLQHFSETAHLYGIFHFGRTVDIGDNKWFQKVNSDNIKEHLTTFLSLLDIYNNNVSNNEKWTKDNISRLTRITGTVPNVKW